MDQITSEGNEPIAIIGMSCRFPGANNISEFWDLLASGENAVRPPPADRWLNGNFKGTEAGFLSVPVDEFDAAFFGISPKEAVYLDPQFRILLQLAWEGLEDAGINPHELRGKPGGVFLGTWQNDYGKILQHSSHTNFFRAYQGNTVGAGASRLSQMLGFTGPSVGTESDCCSSMAAVHLACRSLCNGDAEVALACGANLLLEPFTVDLLPSILSPTWRCRAFDAAADGFARAEGCAVLVLKRVSDAVRDGNKVLGLIRGTSLVYDGLSRSMGTPTVAGEAFAIKQALNDAKIHPSQITYVEAHGTGTVIGDPVEAQAISQAYGNSEREQPLIIGSVKTNIGHTESCAGIAGIIKTILCLKNEMIPKHLNFEKLNPSINFEVIPAVLPLKKIPWPKNEKRRIAGVSSFGVTGNGGHAIIEEWFTPGGMAKVLPSLLERPLHLLKITAQSQQSLDSLLEQYKKYLGESSESFADIVYSSNVGRASFKHRVALIAESKASALAAITSGTYLQSNLDEAGPPGKLCFLFTGQGCQYNGMAKQLYSTSHVFKTNFNYCELFLKRNYNISIEEGFWGEEFSGDKTMYSQLGIFVVEYCLMKLLESWGILPDVVLGHSLGEFCSAVCAEALNVDDALTLIAERSILLEKAEKGNMIAVHTSQAKVERLVGEFLDEFEGNWLDCAAVNSPDQTVLAGDSQTIDKFIAFLNGNNVKCTILNSSHAFHSRHMDIILPAFRKVAEKFVEPKPNKGEIAYVSARFGKIVERSELNANYWVEHFRHEVRFSQACKVACDQEGVDTILEIGPQPVLSALVKANCGNITCLPTLKKGADHWKTLLHSVASLFVERTLDLDWNQFDKYYTRRFVNDLLPTYPFRKTKFWPGHQIVNTTQRNIHPLLGIPLENPTKIKIFQNFLNMEELEYLKDHTIGEMIVFPGAGYLETMLTAGYYAEGGREGESKPRVASGMEINDCSLEAFLGMLPDATCHYQTTVKNEGGEYRIDIYRQSNGNWARHASGIYSAPAKMPNCHDQHETNDTIHVALQSWKEIDVAVKFYERLNQLGVNLGPAFRSIRQLWVDETKQRVLAKVNNPKDSTTYFLHPILIDAMAQVILIQQKKLFQEDGEWVLWIPIKFKSFTWFQPPNSGTCYISSDSPNCAIFVNEDGSLVAQLKEVEMTRSTANTIKVVAETQHKPMPDVYTLEWRAKLGPLQGRVDFTKVADFSQILSEDSAEVELENSVFSPKWGNLITNYILKAFMRMGWSPEPNSTVKLNNAIEKLGVASGYSKQVRLFLIILEQAGYLRFNGEECTVMKEFEITPSISQFDERSEIYSLLKSVGEQLSKILTGAVCPRRLLFPVDETAPSARKFYDCFYSSSKPFLEQIATSQWSEILQVYKESEISLPTIRVLEVGAGTGALTECFLKTLTAAGIPYQYVFTDVSSAFFDLAKNRFHQYQSCMTFRKLNLEEDPTSQGFPPDYFDLVIAVHVIHATRDIKECLLNVRQLLKEGGNLLMTESIGCDVGDFIFGLLEEYWRFEDFDLRRQRPVPPLQVWRRTLLEMGFDRVEHKDLKEMSVIVAKAGAFSVNCLLSRLSPSGRALQKDRTWVMFYHETDLDCALALKSKMELVGRKQMLLVEDTTSLNEFSGVDGILILWGIAGHLTNQEEIAKPFFYLIQNYAQQPNNPTQLVLLTSGQYPIGDTACGNPFTSTMIGIARTTISEYPNLNIRGIDINPKAIGQNWDGIVQEIFNGLEDKTHFVAYRGMTRFIPAFVQASFEPSKVSLLFNQKSSYLITGGLGGVGLEVCRYLVSHGAGQVILVGRRSASDDVQNMIDSLQDEFNCKIRILKTDVGSMTECEEIFGEISNSSYPLRGVFHAAGVIADGLLKDLRWDDFEMTYRAKVNGTWNLHELTKNLDLEHFVLFSSAIAITGQPGQATHASACLFEDEMATYRNGMGLPAITINWGQWGQVGVTTDMDILHMHPFSVQQGINALDNILRLNRNHLIPVNLKRSFGDPSHTRTWLRSVCDPSILNDGKEVVVSRQMTSDQFWNKVKSNEDVDGTITNFIKVGIRQILRMREDEPIPENTDFADLGLDSLIMIEWQVWLQNLVGENIQPSLVRDNCTVRGLTQALLSIIRARSSGKALQEIEEKPNLQEIMELVSNDAVLQRGIYAKCSAVKYSEIKTILLTGATGTVGSYMLRELIETCPHFKIFCLVRPKHGTQAEVRLRSVLEEKGILQTIEIEKVYTIPGDLTETQLGLSADDYSRLSEDVDAVVHCAAKVSHTDYYRNISGDNPRSVNVEGLLRLLELSCESRTKHFYNVGTIMAVNEFNSDGTLRESWPSLESMKVYTGSGYIVSKAVAEVLLGQAVERGIPCKSFRYAGVRGSLKTGRSLVEKNHFMMSLIYMLRKGIMPKAPVVIPFIPIDTAVGTTVKIMFEDNAPNQPYNVIHPQPRSLQECMQALGQGMNCKVISVEWEEWRQTVLEIMKEEKRDILKGFKSKVILSAFQTFYEDQHLFKSYVDWLALIAGSWKKNDNSLVSKNLSTFAPDLYIGMESTLEILKRDLETATMEGLID